MTGKELVINALHREETNRIPWVPFVGVHGGKLLGISANEYLQSGRMIAKGLLKAVELYKPDGLPIVFDLQLEAEQLGCELKWSDKLPPAVVSHPLRSKDLIDLPKYKTESNRFKEIAKAIHAVKDKVKESIALYGLVTGPFTLALHLCGYDMLLGMIKEPEKIKEVVDYCTDITMKTAGFYVYNKVDVIAVVDPMISQITPGQFNNFVAPYVNRVFKEIRKAGLISSLFVCGDATRNLEVMCKTDCDNLSIDDNISLSYMRELGHKYKKSFSGNLNLGEVLLHGTKTQVMKHTIECLQDGGELGYLLAPGCDLPYDTPIENLVTVADTVHCKCRCKKAISAESMDVVNDSIDLIDYKNYGKLIIEVITQDSGSCPPCLYMVKAVHESIIGLEDKVELREYKSTTKEGVALIKALNIKSIPTMLINGKLAYSSQIPDSETLRKRIEALIE